MANALYDIYKNLILGEATATGSYSVPDMDTNNIKAVLVDETDVTGASIVPTSLANYSDYGDLTAGSVALSGNMTSPTFPSNGTIKYANFTFSSVSGDAADSLNFFMDSGTASTSPLILHIDTATGLPVTPNGGDITVTLDASGLFGF